MVCIHQATSHYLNQCWPRSMLPYSFTRSQWVSCVISIATFNLWPLCLPGLFQKQALWTLLCNFYFGVKIKRRRKHGLLVSSGSFSRNLTHFGCPSNLVFGLVINIVVSLIIVCLPRVGGSIWPCNTPCLPAKSVRWNHRSVNQPINPPVDESFDWTNWKIYKLKRYTDDAA